MILTVTPGINLSSVTGPISKAQLNQLGQPTVALLPGSVVASDTNFTQLRIEDGIYPFLQLKNNSAPVDKKYGRLAVATNGEVRLERINDAYTVGTVLASWDASNNTTLSGSLTVNGVIKNVQGTINSGSDAMAWSLCGGSSAPGAATSGGWISLYGGTAAGSPGIIVFGNNTGASGVVTSSGNFGFGTTTPVGRVHIAGGNLVLENSRQLTLLDASGSSPNLIVQGDNNFVFYGTGSTGASRALLQCAMRSDTSPFQVNAPLKIGAAGVAFKSVLKATVTQNPNSGSPLNAGTLYQVTSTVTGALPGALIVIRGIGSNWQNIQVTAECGTADSVIVHYLNAGSSSFTIGATPLDLYVFNT
jgi:hypothetical protein